MNNQTAQGLASLGRNGDTMLVHMSPKEVQGLQGLAMAQGGSLTINPHTGMPEAFKLGNVFSALIPMAAGMFMGPAAGAMFGPASGITSFLSSPLGAGLATGALTAAATGDIGKGAMAGLGAAGGAGLGKGIMNFGATGNAAISPAATTAGLNEGITKTAIQQAMTGGVPNVGIQAGTGAIPGAAGIQLPQYAGAQGFGPSAIGNSSFLQGLEPVASLNPSNLLDTGLGTSPQNLLGTTVEATKPLSAFESLGKGASAIMESPGKFVESYGPGKLALQAAGPLVSGLEPSDLGYGTGSLYEDPDKGKYRGPTGQLNLSDRYDTGLRLMAIGGAVDVNPPEGGGISDLYNRPEGQRSTPLSTNGYGIGRLNSLAGEQSMTQAQTLGYAMGGLTALKSGGQPGGYLDGEGDGMSDSIPATIEGKQPARLADGEFVIPADVVSHLGNGSSKAGSKRLYAMLDKVRQARTGNKKQGKEIKAEKYLPA